MPYAERSPTALLAATIERTLVIGLAATFTVRQ
jgi:hypothetical protein